VPTDEKMIRSLEALGQQVEACPTPCTAASLDEQVRHKAGVRLWRAHLSDPVQFLVLLCHKRSRVLTRRQQGHLGSVLSKAAAIRSRKLVIDDGTWRCVRGASARFVMRG